MKKHYITQITLWTVTILITLAGIVHASPAIDLKASSYGIASKDIPLLTAYNVGTETHTVRTISASDLPIVCAVFAMTTESGIVPIDSTDSNLFTIKMSRPATEILLCWPAWGEDIITIIIK